MYGLEPADVFSLLHRSSTMGLFGCGLKHMDSVRMFAYVLSIAWLGEWLCVTEYVCLCVCLWQSLQQPSRHHSVNNGAVLG